MSMPLAHYLKDFSSAAASRADFGGHDFGDIQDDGLDFGASAIDETPPVDVEAERREAFASGHEAGAEEARIRYEAELDALREAHRQELLAVEHRSADEIATVITAGLRHIAESVSSAVVEQTAAALSPFLSELVAEKSLQNLAAQIEGAIVAGEAAALVVRGPQGLHDRLVELLPEAESNIRFIEADDLDLTVEIGETILVTRISAWTASLKKVLG